ncbi:MAG: TonB family protein [Pseudomonadales bacterium]
MQQGNIKKALDNLDNAGYRLRCAREYMGLSEKEVADELKLMVSHVRAIEQNRSEYLVQRKPFERYLRAYARLVQLNPDTIVDMYFSKSAPQPTQPVDITTRLEIPPQPVITPPDASRWQFARNNYYHPAILGTGFLVIGLSLFAGWGVKQLVGSQQNRPVLAQNDFLEVRASTRRQPVAAAALPELADIQFEKPVTSVPTASSVQLEPFEVAARESVIAEGAILQGTDKLAISTPKPAAVEPLEVASQDAELQPFAVQLKQRPEVEVIKTVTAKAATEKPKVADSSRKLAVTDVVKAPSKANSAVPAIVNASTDAVAATASLADSLPLAVPTPTVKTKVATIKPIKSAKLKETTSPKTQTVKVKPMAIVDTSVAAGKVAAGKVAAGKEKVAAIGAAEIKPVLKPATVSSRRKSDRESNRKVDDGDGKQLFSQKSSELNVLREPAEKSIGQAATDVAVVAASQSAATSLKPQKVIAKKLIAPQQTKVQESPEMEDLQQVIAASSDPISLAAATPFSGSETIIDSASGLDFGPGLDDEASDLDAVISAGTAEEAQPFEVALSNSSDSASVARLALLESYKSTLRRRVYENVTYPGRARRRNLEGKVVMSATVSRAGELLSVEMAEASKYDALNRASEKAIKQSSPFPAAPDTLSGDAFVLTVPVVFKIPER